MFNDPLPNNRRLYLREFAYAGMCLPSRCLTMDIRVTILIFRRSNPPPHLPRKSYNLHIHMYAIGQSSIMKVRLLFVKYMSRYFNFEALKLFVILNVLLLGYHGANTFKLDVYINYKPNHNLQQDKSNYAMIKALNMKGYAYT
jgi:hypothetical protein